MFYLLVLFGVVAAFFVIWLSVRMYLARASKHWPSVNGVLSDVKISIEHKGDNGSSYFPTVSYKYEVSNNKYYSDRLAYGVFWFWAYDQAVRSVQGMEVDGRVTVYYDPKRPWRSALIRGQGGSDIWIFAIASFWLVIFLSSVVRLLLSE